MEYTTDSSKTSIAVAVVVTLLVVAVRWIASLRCNLRGLPLPPGPPRKWLVGNLSHIPNGANQWLGFEHLAKIYGELLSLCAAVLMLKLLWCFAGDLVYFSGLGN